MIHHLGTMGRTNPFRSPHDLKEITVSTSVPEVPVAEIVGKNTAFSYEVKLNGGMDITIDLKGHIARLTAYRLAYSVENFDEAPRAKKWVISGVEAFDKTGWKLLQTKPEKDDDFLDEDDDDELDEMKEVSRSFIIQAVDSKVTPMLFRKLRFSIMTKKKKVLLPRIELFGELDPLQVDIEYLGWEKGDMLAAYRRKSDPPDKLHSLALMQVW